MPGAKGERMKQDILRCLLYVFWELSEALVRIRFKTKGHYNEVD